jgi:ATP-binding cassette subfamily G (WHITE) protein 2
VHTRRKGGAIGLTRRRAILEGVSGACYPGQVLAVMGATGSGKTSLMNILARRLVLTPGLRVGGEVRLNGRRRRAGWKSNYVQQDDLLFGELTVRETLVFSARMRLPARLGAAARAARVDAVVATLGLRAVLDSRVRARPHKPPTKHTPARSAAAHQPAHPSPLHAHQVGGELARGISGGERKRLTLGVELVTNPPLLFLDEPTSGLDAFNAQSVMSSLKLLAATGRAVVACLHQPRSAITALFDALLLLSEGRVMFSGDAAEALPFFERWGFTCPPHTNPSDFYLDVVSLSFHSPAAEAASRARVALLGDAYASEAHAQLAALRSAGDAAAAARSTSRQQQLLQRAGASDGGHAVAEGGGERSGKAEDAAAAAQKGANNNNGAEAENADDLRRPAALLPRLHRYAEEWRALAGRAARLAARQRLENGINIIRTVIFSLLLGLIWLNVGRDASGAPGDLRNLGGLLFISIVNHSFGGVFAVVFVFAGECRLILRERVAGMYGVLPYFASRLVVELPRDALWTLLHCTLIYWIVGLRANASAFFIFLAIHLLISLNAEGLTLLFTAATRSEKLASAVAPIPLVINILFGGFFTQPGAIPVWLRWIRYLCFMRWSFVALVVNEMRGRTFDCPPGLPPAQCVRDGHAAIELLAPDAALGLGACAWVLTGMVLACWVGTYAVLRANKPRYDVSV